MLCIYIYIFLSDSSGFLFITNEPQPKTMEYFVQSLLSSIESSPVTNERGKKTHSGKRGLIMGCEVQAKRQKGPGNQTTHKKNKTNRAECDPFLVCPSVQVVEIMEYLDLKSVGSFLVSARRTTQIRSQLLLSVIQTKYRCMPALRWIQTNNWHSFSYWENLFILNRSNSLLPLKEKTCVLCTIKITKQAQICHKTGLVVCHNCMKSNFRSRGTLELFFRTKDIAAVSMYLCRGTGHLFAPCDVALLKPRVDDLVVWQSTYDYYAERLAHYSRLSGGLLRYKRTISMPTNIGCILVRDYDQFLALTPLMTRFPSFESSNRKCVITWFRSCYLVASTNDSRIFTNQRRVMASASMVWYMHEFMRQTCLKREPGWCIVATTP
jgi:hypothetical protein